MKNFMNTKKGISSTVLAVTIVIALIAAAGGYLIMSGNVAPGSTTTTTTRPTTGATSVTSASSTFVLSSPVTLSAGGSSFVNPVMQVWASAYHDAANSLVSINYQSIGSGAGQQGVFTNTFDFAGSDAPVSDRQLANFTGRTLLQIPETLGAVSVFYNVPEIGTTSLKLTGDVIAKIFLTQVAAWNDPAITSLNPGVNLPAKPIIPVHRSDGSGTTFAFTDFLSKVSSTWANQIGKGTSVNWPSSELGGKGSDGVAGIVKQNPYAIGYADYFYAAENNLAVAAVQNQTGNYTLPSLSTITAAAGQFATQLQSDPRASIANAPGPDSYPISTFTYLLVWKDQSSSTKGYATAQFFWWIVHSGQQYGPKLYYPALPSNVVTIDEGLIKQINYNGQAFIR